MTDIGDDVTLTTQIRVGDELTEPGTVHLEVTDPAGTPVEPTITNVATGVYQAVVLANAAGRWRYKWTTTDPASVDFSYFDVEPNPPPPARPDALVTIDELEDRLGRDLTPDEARRAEALIADASALIRAYTGQSFDLVRGDVVRLRRIGDTLELPQKPVLAVSGVVAVSTEGTIPLAGWCWTGGTVIDLGWIDPNVWVSLPSWWHGCGCASEYEVTYDHGYEQTPPDIVAIVCGMVNRVVTAPSMAEGMLSERVGPFGYTLQQGSGTPGPKVRLTQDDKDALADGGYRDRAGTIMLRA